MFTEAIKKFFEAIETATEDEREAFLTSLRNVRDGYKKPANVDRLYNATIRIVKRAA